ncbi:hypothetical protein ACFQX6_41880 [Streptosporangium lutulentum]
MDDPRVVRGLQAPAVCWTTSRVTSTLSLPSRARMPASDSPGTSSITR